MCIDRQRFGKRRQTGFTIIELIMFMIVVSIGVAGVLLVMNQVTSHSADPIVRKQAIAIAEAMMEEIELQPFTFCDPDDANLTSATSAAVGAGSTFCATTAQTTAPTPGESRYTNPKFDNVGDYNGFSMSGINDRTNTPIPGLSSYTVNVTVANAGVTFGLAAGEAVKIDVLVTGPGNTSITLTSYRFRYAPNTAS